MKKGICVIFFLVIVFSVYGQSLNETIDWMNSKLDKANEMYKESPSHYTGAWHDSVSLTNFIFSYMYYGVASDDDEEYPYVRYINKVSLLELNENKITVDEDYPWYTVKIETMDGTDDIESFFKNSSQKIPSISETLAEEPEHESTLYIGLPTQEIAERFVNAMRHLISVAKEQNGNSDLF